MNAKSSNGNGAKKSSPSYPRPPRSRDPNHLSIGFETVAAALAEGRLRISDLEKAGHSGHLAAARLLSRCRPRSRCSSAACPICSRDFRAWLTGQALAVFAPFNELIFVSIVGADTAVDAADISDISPKRLKDQLRQQFHRVGIRGVPVIGGLDGEFDAFNQLWQPHFHVLAPAELREAFNTLNRRFYQSVARVYRPVLVNQVADRARQLTYTIKSYWPAKIRFTNANGHESTVRRRLPTPRHADWLAWRAEFRPEDFMFLSGVRRRGHELDASACQRQMRDDEKD